MKKGGKEKKSGNKKKRGINSKVFLVPGVIWIVGLLLCITQAPRTSHLNSGVVAGILLLCVATIMALSRLNRECTRVGCGKPFFLDFFFPDYPEVPDTKTYHTQLSAFRDAYGEFLSDPQLRPNSSLQNVATQIMWHTFALQKRRLMKFGVTIGLDAKRRAYSSVNEAVREGRYFDGKYNVSDVYEEIDAYRTFTQGNRELLSLHDKEVAHYTFLSARTNGGTRVTCPNCANTTTRENLIDGCDYCGTKFTVEDLGNRVSAFGFRRDFRVGESKRGAVTRLIHPWIMMLSMMPLIYFALVGAFIYTPDESIFIKPFFALFAAGLFGLLGFVLVKLYEFIIVPLILLFGASWGFVNKNIIYRKEEEEEQEKEISSAVRRYDSLFSLQSFLSGIQNKISAIHFADNSIQVNAFSDCDLSGFLRDYAQVIDIDTESLIMDAYEVRGGVQYARVHAGLQLREFANGKIRTRKEALQMVLEKSAECKTQAVCAVSVLKCAGCGASLSLMEGKSCEYCGRELDMKRHDWVITSYRGGKRE